MWPRILVLSHQVENHGYRWMKEKRGAGGKASRAPGHVEAPGFLSQRQRTQGSLGSLPYQPQRHSDKLPSMRHIPVLWFCLHSLLCTGILTLKILLLFTWDILHLKTTPKHIIFIPTSGQLSKCYDLLKPSSTFGNFRKHIWEGTYLSPKKALTILGHLWQMF